jgi:hypothetical protein
MRISCNLPDKVFMDVRPLRDAAPGPFRQAGQPCTPYPGNQGVPAMSTELLINVTPQETRVAVIENGVVQEILIERANRRGLVGNVYKGRVCRVLPGMQAAFVDIGLARAAFLHASDVVDPAAQRDRPAPAPDPDSNGAESA